MLSMWLTLGRPMLGSPTPTAGLFLGNAALGMASPGGDLSSQGSGGALPETFRSAEAAWPGSAQASCVCPSWRGCGQGNASLLSPGAEPTFSLW